jgi:predicted nicotinamide N-methyase
VWNGGLVLGRYVERLGAGFFQGKSCVELGSGTGLTGVIAAKVPHRHTLHRARACVRVRVRLVDVSPRD